MSADKAARYMPIAQALAEMSRYQGTRVGALALGGGYEICSQGWNGAPRGSRADVDARSEDRHVRLAWAVHAEANLVANAARNGVSLIGCTVVVTHPPCMGCAKLLAQAGVSRVISKQPDARFVSNWGQEMEMARQLFDEVGIEYMEIST